MAAEAVTRVPDPSDMNRLRRFCDQSRNLLNALVRSGLLERTGQDDYTLTVPLASPSGLEFSGGSLRVDLNTSILSLAVAGLGFANQTANTGLLGPTSGGAAAPTFRALVAADVAGLVPVVLVDHFTDAGNSGTTETDLFTYTTAAGRLAANGQKLQFIYGGAIVGHATATRQVRVYFGGTAIFDSTALSFLANEDWVVRGTIIRVDGSTVRYAVTFTTPTTVATVVGSLGSLTLSNTNIIKITGQAAGAGAATNDIVAKAGTVLWEPSGS